MTFAKVVGSRRTSRFVTQLLEQHLNGKDVELKDSLELSQELADMVLKEVNQYYESEKVTEPTKHVVLCNIQEHGAGLKSSSSCLWNPETDVATCVKYEHKNIDIIIHVYSVSC